MRVLDQIPSDERITRIGEHVRHLEINICGTLEKCTKDEYLIRWDDGKVWNHFWSIKSPYVKYMQVVFELDLPKDYRFDPINDLMKIIDAEFYSTRIQLLEAEVENDPEEVLFAIKKIIQQRKDRQEWEKFNRKAMKGGW